MNLKSFGCSFTFGTDLPDASTDRMYFFSSQLVWPALIAKKFGYYYKSYAWPGAGNLQILESLLNNIKNDNTDIYVINWTWIDRFDYVSSSPISNQASISLGSRWKTLRPTDINPVTEIYYKNLHSEYQDKLSSLIYIKTAIDVLRTRNCKFIMTYIDDLIFCKKWNITPFMVELMEEVRPFLSQFQNQNFLEWSKKNQFPISDALHPLEDAHRAAADFILSQWDDYIRS